MLYIAHRGCIDKENTIEGISEAFQMVSCVEIDVRYNSERKIVLCHDREKRNDENEYFEDLLKLKSSMHLFIDIKAFGVETAKQLARDIVLIIKRYAIHKYEICSFNEYCVQELLDLRICSKGYVTPFDYTVGVITSGVSVGIYNHMHLLDFISFNYDTIHEELFKNIAEKKIYAWANIHQYNVYSPCCI